MSKKLFKIYKNWISAINPNSSQKYYSKTNCPISQKRSGTKNNEKVVVEPYAQNIKQ